MNGKKEQERSELHRTIWKIANDLRGSVDGWDFKQYTLGMLFYRYISENLKKYLNEEELKAGNKGFDYAKISDEQAEYGREETIPEKGLYILPSELFENVLTRKDNEQNLNITLGKVFRNIENSARGTSSEHAVKGLFDDFDPDSSKLGDTVKTKNEKLIKIMKAIAQLDLGNENYSDNSIDAFGDAYEFLMTMYASNAGKSGGEFFTPQEVGELLARIVIMDKKQVKKVYDPACGSGSLLLKFAKILGKENVTEGFFGQELNLTTYNLCRINMFLHNINFSNFNIALGDTLTNAKHWNYKPFDAIVSNPPYSVRWPGNNNPLLINDDRYSPAAILAPEGKADLAFTMHMVNWLSEDGTAAIVQFPGVLYRGGPEQKIRKYLVEGDFIDAVIQLPQDLFFGTSIATCIIVLKKSMRTDTSILFVDASNEYIKGDNENKLSNENIDNIVDILRKRTNIENKAILVPKEEIIENECNLSVNSYLTKESEEEQIEIKEINNQINEIVKQENKLKTEIDKIIKELEEKDE